MTIQEFIPPPHGNITWTDDRIVELKHRRFTLKESCGYIAKGMGLSRSAVIGKISRLGLSQPRPEKATKPAPLVSLRPTTSGGRKRRKSTGDRPNEFTPRPVGDEPTDIVVEFIPLNPIRFIDSTEQTCKWPLGEPSAAMLICGDPVRDQSGCPYCSYHARVAYSPSAPRKPWVEGRAEG